MLFFQWQIVLFAIAIYLLLGFLLAISMGALLSTVLRLKRRYLLDGAVGMIGFLVSWVNAASEYGAIEINGIVVGWQPGTRWPQLRAWAFTHGFLAAAIGCAASVAVCALS
jgi:hypothetical protein